MVESPLTMAEQYEFIQEVRQKMNEFRNSNLEADNVAKIKIMVAIVELYLACKGRRFLEQEIPSIKLHRQMLLGKIAEFAEYNEAQENAEYMEKAELLKEMIGEINNRERANWPVDEEERWWVADAEGKW
jgi:hypothetical protein